MVDPRTCRNCHRPLPPASRKDKKFCSRMCSADYHQARKVNRFINLLGSKDILNYV